MGLAEVLAGGGGDRVCEIFKTWAQTKATDRLFECQDVTHATACASHPVRTQRFCGRPCCYLLIEDTTPLNYTGLADCVGLGPIGVRGSRGLLAHTTLAVRCESGAG